MKRHDACLIFDQYCVCAHRETLLSVASGQRPPWGTLTVLESDRGVSVYSRREIVYSQRAVGTNGFQKAILQMMTEMLDVAEILLSLQNLPPCLLRNRTVSRGGFSRNSPMRSCGTGDLLKHKTL